MLEIVVIGAGLAGFAAALALWERGAAVTLVEVSRPGAGATGASAGMLVAQYESEGPDEKFRLCLESRRRYPEWAAKVERLSGRELSVRWDGLLVANFTSREHEQAVATADWQVSEGLEAEVVNAEDAARIQPGVSPGVASYLWLPGEGQLDSQILAGALWDAIGRTEIRLITGKGAAGILSQGGGVVGVSLVDGGTLEADRVVLAAGAWSGTISGLPRTLPVRPVRGQMLRFPAGAVSLERIVASHAGRYLVPRADGTVLAGSTMEDVGFDRSITDAGLTTIHESVSQLVPAFADRRPVERWAGLRPISADRRPVLGPDPEMDGLLYATGYGRDGILVSPLVGAVVADLAVSGESEFDWRPFRPDREWSAAD
jgi:glycine oxidase